MLRLPALRAKCVVLLLFLLSGSPALAAEEKIAPQLLPASTLVYFEVRRPKQALNLLLDHPLRKQIEQAPDLKQAMESPKFKEFQAVVGLVEQRLGMNWRQALGAVTGGGIVVAFDPETQGVALFIKPQDKQAADSLRETIFSLARQDAASKGAPDPIQTEDYRGITGYELGEAVLGNLGPWVVFSNKVELGKEIADRYLDGGSSLADNAHFAEAVKLRDQSEHPCAAWAYFALEGLRGMAGGQPWLDAGYKSDNPVAELILGGLLPVVRHAPFATASITLDQQTFALSIQAPNDPAWEANEHSFYFGKPEDGASPALRPKGTVLSLSTFRDISAMWQAGPDLFSEPVAAKMAQADSTLSTLFRGKSFSTDVLAGLKPQIQLVIARQDFGEAGAPTPGIRLPAGALVLQIKQEQYASVKRHLRVGFQSIVALTNIDGGAKGRPLLDIQTENRAGGQIMYAAFDTDSDAPKSGKAADGADKKPAGPAMRGDAARDIYLNFSPAIVMNGEYLILCSTRQLAENLADEVARNHDQHPVPQANTIIDVDPIGIAQLILDNREQLVAQNMLNKGNDRESAEKQINLLHSIVQAFSDASLKLVRDPKSVTIELQVKTAAKW